METGKVAVSELTELSVAVSDRDKLSILTIQNPSVTFPLPFLFCTTVR